MKAGRGRVRSYDTLGDGLRAARRAGMRANHDTEVLLRMPRRSTMGALGEYIGKAFRWQRGRQGSGYDKMLLLTAPWPIAFDSYLIRYPVGSRIPPHTDPVGGRAHYRLNLILKRSRGGGEFICRQPIVSTARIKLFRPDLCEHSVTEVTGSSRYLLSIGWLWGKTA